MLCTPGCLALLGIAIALDHPANIIIWGVTQLQLVIIIWSYNEIWSTTKAIVMYGFVLNNSWTTKLDTLSNEQANKIFLLQELIIIALAHSPPNYQQMCLSEGWLWKIKQSTVTQQTYTRAHDSCHSLSWIPQTVINFMPPPPPPHPIKAALGYPPLYIQNHICSGGVDLTPWPTTSKFWSHL